MKTFKMFCKKYQQDTLTGLPLRAPLENYANYLIENNIPFTYFILDIDNFKNYNDTYGHHFGDEVLKLVVSKINSICKNKNIAFSRVGGDEFALILENEINYDEVHKFATKFSLEFNLNKTNTILGNSISITRTMGCSRFPLDSDNYEDLMITADKALYRGKQKGRNCFIIYVKEKHEKLQLLSANDSKVNIDQKVQEIINYFTLHPAKSADNIKEAIYAIGSLFSIDHICLDDEKSIYCNYYHPLNSERNYRTFENNLHGLSIVLNKQDFYFSSKDEIKTAIFPAYTAKLRSQKILAQGIFKISVNNHFYGYLRTENKTSRIWQHEAISAFKVLSALIGLSLYYNNLEIKDLQ